MWCAALLLNHTPSRTPEATIPKCLTLWFQWFSNMFWNEIIPFYYSYNILCPFKTWVKRPTLFTSPVLSIAVCNMPQLEVLLFPYRLTFPLPEFWQAAEEFAKFIPIFSWIPKLLGLKFKLESWVLQGLLYFSKMCNQGRTKEGSIYSRVAFNQ